tara:strand:+ start:5090 stop:5317 length:228 start_codon:yes stop_codon:yes gene_type:complete
MSRMYNRGLSLIKKLQQKIDETKQQYETPIVVSTTKPSNSEGVDGDRKVVQEATGNFLYIKVGNRWMKTILEEVG